MVDSIKTYKAGNITIKVDTSKCISCGTCCTLAPKTFELDENMISKVKDEGPYDDIESIKGAAASCSGEAITIEVEETPAG